MAVEMQTGRDGAELLDFLHRRGEYVDAQRPHLIVLEMPKVNGLAALSAIKDCASLRSIPVVVLSSSDRPQDLSRTYAGEAKSYVTQDGQPDRSARGPPRAGEVPARVSALPGR